jgi:hypothetical protein
MLQQAIVVRLPDSTEYWYGESVPEVGRVVSLRGRTYVVLRCDVEEDGAPVVTLTPADEVVPVPAAPEPHPV